MPYSDPKQEQAYQLKYRQQHADKLSAAGREWRIANADALKLAKKADYERNKEAYKARAKASRERRVEELKTRRSTPEYKAHRNALRRAKYVAHPAPPARTREELLEAKRLHYNVNKVSIRAKQTDYYKSNKIKWKYSWQKKDYWKQKFEHGIKKAVCKRAIIEGVFSLKTFYKQVYTKKTATCEYCRGEFPVKQITVDHKQPYKLGGAHAVSNLSVSCLVCNLKKGIKPFSLWTAQGDKCQ